MPPWGGWTKALALVAAALVLVGAEYVAIRNQLVLARFDKAPLTTATIKSSQAYRPTRRGDRHYRVALDYAQVFAGQAVACHATSDFWGGRRDFAVGDTVEVMVPAERCGRPVAREEFEPPAITHFTVFAWMAFMLLCWLFYHAMERTRRAA